MDRIAYFQFRNHFRRTVNGVCDCCPDCGRPSQFKKNDEVGDYDRVHHRCRMMPTIAVDALTEDERLEDGFAILGEMSSFGDTEPPRDIDFEEACLQLVN